MTTIISVLELMDGIEKTNHATQSWWPSLKALLEAQEKVNKENPAGICYHRNDWPSSEIGTDCPNCGNLITKKDS